MLKSIINQFQKELNISFPNYFGLMKCMKRNLARIENGLDSLVFEDTTHNTIVSAVSANLDKILSLTNDEMLTAHINVDFSDGTCIIFRCFGGKTGNNIKFFAFNYKKTMQLIVQANSVCDVLDAGSATPTSYTNTISKLSLHI